MNRDDDEDESYSDRKTTFQCRIARRSTGTICHPATIKHHVAANKTVNLVLAFGIKINPVQKLQRSHRPY